MKKVIALLLSAVLISAMILSAVFPSYALASSNISFDVKKYDASTGNYTTVNQANAGDTIYIATSLSRVESLGGITFTLDFNTEFFSFDKSKSFSTIIDEKSEVFFNSKGGKISVIWETVNNDTTVSGTIFYIALKVADAVAVDTDCTFPAAVTEMFDGSDNQTTINCKIESTANVKVITSKIPEEFLTLASAVKTLSYNPKNDPDLPKDSLAAITAAESAFAGLTTSQQVAFRDNYPELYDALNTARTRYYKLAETEADKIILKEINDFKNKFAEVLNLTVDTVKVDDKIKVNSAYDWMNNILSKEAQKKLDDQTKNKITDLRNKIKALEAESSAKEEAAVEVKDFLETYGYMFKDSYMETFDLAYDVDGPIVLEAIMVYENLLSELAQKQLDSEYKTLQKLKGLIDVYTADDQALAETLQKVADFQKPYIKVYALNAGNVSITDKAAIEMVIEAFNNLKDDEDADLKERLQPKILQLQGLLKVIEELEKAQKEENNSVVEDNTDTTPQTPDSSVKTEVQTITKWLNKNFITESGLGWPIVILLIMIGVSVCCLIASAAISEYANNLKKRNDGVLDE